MDAAGHDARTAGQKVLDYVLFVLFGIGSWLLTSSLYTEGPIYLPHGCKVLPNGDKYDCKGQPEGYRIYAILDVAVEVANVVAIAYILVLAKCASASRRARSSGRVFLVEISIVLLVTAAASFFVARTWNDTVHMSGRDVSLPLIGTSFVSGATGAMSMLVFFPFATERGSDEHASALSVGVGLCGLVASILGVTQNVQHPDRIRYSTETYFDIVAIITVASWISFLVLWHRYGRDGKSRAMCPSLRIELGGAFATDAQRSLLAAEQAQENSTAVVAVERTDPIYLTHGLMQARATAASLAEGSAPFSGEKEHHALRAYSWDSGVSVYSQSSSVDEERVAASDLFCLQGEAPPKRFDRLRKRMQGAPSSSFLSVLGNIDEKVPLEELYAHVHVCITCLTMYGAIGYYPFLYKTSDPAYSSYVFWTSVTCSIGQVVGRTVTSTPLARSYHLARLNAMQGAGFLYLVTTGVLARWSAQPPAAMTLTVLFLFGLCHGYLFTMCLYTVKRDVRGSGVERSVRHLGLANQLGAMCGSLITFALVESKTIIHG